MSSLVDSSKVTVVAAPRALIEAAREAEFAVMLAAAPVDAVGTDAPMVKLLLAVADS
jgi:hypothetical protein